MLALCWQDGDITVEYRPLEDTVDPSNMLCAGKVCFSEKKILRTCRMWYSDLSDSVSAISHSKQWLLCLVFG